MKIRTLKTIGISSILLSGIFLLSQSASSASVTLRPTSDGTYSTWSPSSSSFHYENVDEITCNGKTDYNFTDSTGDRDSYGVTLTTIPNGAKITSIEISPCASRNKNGGGPSASSVMDVFYRFSGIDSSDQGGYDLTGTTPVALSSTVFSGLSHIKGTGSTLELGAVYANGNKGVRLGKIETTISYAPLIAPNSLVATQGGATSVNVTWTDVTSAEEGYSIERSTNSPFGPWTEIATTSADATSYSDETGLSADQTYYYRVRAFNSGANSSYSNTDYAITATTVPNAPSNLSAMASSSSSVLISWSDNSTNEENFSIERSTNSPFGPWTEIASTSLNTTSYSDETGLSADQTYYYRVRAGNSIGNSSYSNTDYAITATTVPNAPSNLFAFASSSSVSISWSDNSTNEESFTIERGTNGVDFSFLTSTTLNFVSYLDTDVSPGTYYYRVYASNEIGSSAYSNTASTTVF